MNLSNRYFQVRSSLQLAGWVCVLVILAMPCLSAENLPDAAKAEPSSEQNEKIEDSIERALAWLAKQQEANGSFRTHDTAQPAVTSLCLLAFLADGHVPRQGSYGKTLDHGIDFVLSCQRSDGLLTYVPPGTVHHAWKSAHTAIYNHAFAGLLLSQVYGITSDDRASRLRPVIEQALAFTRTKQVERKRNSLDQGGMALYTPGWGD